MSKRDRPLEMRFITRIDGASGHHYWVRIEYGGERLASRVFSDSRHGGTQEAYRAVKAYRDRMVRKYKIPIRIYRGNGYYVRHARSSSGVCGVSFYVQTKDNGRSYLFWQASYVASGVQHHRRFSVKRHGYVEAFLFACRVRFKATGRTMPDNISPPPPPLEIS